MEFKTNNFIHRSVTFCNNFSTSSFGNVHYMQIEHFISSDFLTCYKPERFDVEHVFFHFDECECQSYYKVSFKDTIVQFQLYFFSFSQLSSFFFHYDDDYNLLYALNIVFHGGSIMCSFDECLSILFSNAIRESLDVLEPAADSEHRGLSEDDLPF